MRWWEVKLRWWEVKLRWWEWAGLLGIIVLTVCKIRDALVCL